MSIYYLIAIIAVVLFMALLMLFKLPEIAQNVLTKAGLAATVVTSKELTDAEKEKLTQQHAKTIIMNFIQLTAGSVAALGVPTLAIYAMDYAGLLSSDVIFETMISWQFIVLATVISIAMFVYKPKKNV